MNPIPVAVFDTETEAELARSTLEAAGIRATIAADDVGGALPSLDITSGIRVMVMPDDEARAREVLHPKSD